ncbi:MAG: ion transporter [Deltaproteobacteria bacterium]|nr:ion transporter [Deltaproteobacteria bacterium]
MSARPSRPVEPGTASSPEQALEDERGELLHRLEAWLEVPMIVLGFVWLGLLVFELLSSASAWFETLGTIIWIVFLLDFAIKFAVAPRKVAFLRTNWLTAIALLVPALRVFRIFRVLRILRLAQATRGLRLVRLVSSVNRSMRALGASMSRRGVGYVAVLTLLITLAGAAGMYAFENDRVTGLNSYGEALWWTAMIMTTMGSQDWPQSVEGRVLCVLLALYAFAVFGYVTATLASFFIGRDGEREHVQVAGVDTEAAMTLSRLHDEVAALRDELRAFARREGP